MACDLNTIQTAACISGFAKVDDATKLLQLIAQGASDWALAANPGTDMSLAAIQARACTSGFGKEQDSVKLLQYWAQNLCSLQS